MHKTRLTLLLTALFSTALGVCSFLWAEGYVSYGLDAVVAPISGLLVAAACAGVLVCSAVLYAVNLRAARLEATEQAEAALAERAELSGRRRSLPIRLMVCGLALGGPALASLGGFVFEIVTDAPSRNGLWVLQAPGLLWAVVDTFLAVGVLLGSRGAYLPAGVSALVRGGFGLGTLGLLVLIADAPLLATPAGVVGLELGRSALYLCAAFFLFSLRHEDD